MIRRWSRPLGVLLLALLAASPVVRALCAMECRSEGIAHAAAPAGSAEQTSHCAPKKAEADATHVVNGLADCSGCAASRRAAQATLRAEAKAPVAGLAQVTVALVPSKNAVAAIAVVVARLGSPPLRSPYPLRI